MPDRSARYPRTGGKVNLLGISKRVGADTRNLLIASLYLSQFLYRVKIRVINSVKPQQELDLLVNVIEHHPEGVNAEEVLQESGLTLQRRSLLRRLAVLVEQGRIRVEGQARAVRYFPGLQDERSSGVGSSSAEAETEPYVPVSAEGEAIKAYVRQPRHLRKPVVYRTEVF